MGRRRSLSKNNKNSALGILLSGLSCRNVACTFEVAPSTISILFNRFNDTNSMCDSARSGYTRVTTQLTSRQLHKNSQLRNRTLYAHTLTHELRTITGVKVSDQTIRNRLCTRNLRPRRPVVRISRNRHHKRIRLYRCQHHLRWTAGQWQTSVTVFVSTSEHDSSAGYNHCHRLGRNFPDFVGIHTPK